MTAPGHQSRSGWPDLHEGQRFVLSELIVNGPRARADLARTVGRSPGSLTRISRDLMELGLVLPGETSRSAARGRPSEDLMVRPDAGYFVGVKLTGEALHAVVTDLTGQVRMSEQVTLVERDMESVVELIAETTDRLVAGLACPAGIGVCLAGDIEDHDGVPYLTDSPFLGWDRPVPLSQLVEQAVGMPSVVTNDVQALTTGHHWFGPGAGLSSLVVIAIGAGIGAGFVIDHHIVTGAYGRHGKIGHVLISVEGPHRCGQGHTGCADAHVTMPGITSNAGFDEYEQALAAARRGDPDAERAFHQASIALGAIVAQFVNVLDPQLIIVTGEGLDMVELAPEPYQQSLSERLDPRAVRSDRIRMYPFEFTDYAQGAAITAMRHVVLSA
jgi:predicted NBD/HSP70 family sugar kinase